MEDPCRYQSIDMLLRKDVLVFGDAPELRVEQFLEEEIKLQNIIAVAEIIKTLFTYREFGN